MTRNTTQPEVARNDNSKTKTDTLSRLFETARAASNPHIQSEARNRACLFLQTEVEKRLRLSRSARSYRDDCVQELTFGLFQLLDDWSRQGKLGDIRSFGGFVSHYLKWHLPPTLRRLKFAFGSSQDASAFLHESDLSEYADLHNHPMRRTGSGCLDATDANADRRDSERAALRDLQLAELDAPGRRVLELLDSGETGRRRIEMTLVEEFGHSHRQARRFIDELAERIREYL